MLAQYHGMALFQDEIGLFFGCGGNTRAAEKRTPWKRQLPLFSERSSNALSAPVPTATSNNRMQPKRR